jgi:cytochrome c biogenesis protein CcmG/thiol:disulfide interchange protein DsbE
MKARFLIPLGLFLALAGLFWFVLNQMNRGDYNPRELPSALIDKPAPTFSLPNLHQPDQTIGTPNFIGQVSLFNVWASWCVSCRVEHPFFMELARRNEVPIYGLNYKDERADALRWLDQLGNPYVASAFDFEGRVGIDWGVYGVPETFVVDKAGKIRMRFPGPVTEEVWNRKFVPLIAQLRSEQG